MNGYIFLALLVELASAYLAPDGTVIIPGASSYNGLALAPAMGWDNVRCNSRLLDSYRTDHDNSGTLMDAISTNQSFLIRQKR